MPRNNDLEPVVLPMSIRFDEKPTTRFVNNLSSIDIELINAPTMADLRSYLPPFLEATWAEGPMDATNLSLERKDEIIRECFFGRALPTALETIGLTFKVSGISLQEVTHLLRHRTASFSADCSGDKWWTHKDALVPNSIEQSTEFYDRYQALVEASKQLYCDMIDSKQISIMDARYILPRCLSTFYFMRISLKDAIGFIKQRMDKQIQPETDNLIAYYMYCHILKQYPIANGLIDIHETSWFFAKMARTGKATNLYYPDQDSDKFEWNEKDFIYQSYRNEMNGTDEGATNLFDEYMMRADEHIERLEDANKAKLDMDYGQLWRLENDTDPHI